MGSRRNKSSRFGRSTSQINPLDPNGLGLGPNHPDYPYDEDGFVTLTTPQARELIAELERAIVEAKDHELPMIATVFDPLQGIAGHRLSIKVKPEIKFQGFVPCPNAGISRMGIGNCTPECPICHGQGEIKHD